MNKRNKIIAAIAFYSLVVGLLAYAASRTLEFVQSTMPADKAFWGYLFLLSTGGGAIIWLLVFRDMAEGAKQRAIAFLLGIIDLIGELIMVYADTIRVSAERGQLTMTPQELQTFITASVGIIGVNIAAAYAFHLFDPKTEQESHARDLVDEVTDASLKQLNTPAARQQMIDELAPSLSEAIQAEVRAQVARAAGRHITAAAAVAAIPAPPIFTPREATTNQPKIDDQEQPEPGDSFRPE